MITIIAALADHNAIGARNALLCRLPNDMRRFRQLTVGHAVVMGRKTYESLPCGALPDRTNIVITSNQSASFPDCRVFNNLASALEAFRDDEIFIIGGAAVYEQTIALADKMYISQINHEFADADAFFPRIDPEEWIQTECEAFQADEKHPYPYSFLTYIRKKISKKTQKTGQKICCKT